MARKLIVEADGGSRGNPGPAGYGAAVLDAETGEVLAEVAESIGRATNNVAEYRGLIAGLSAAARLAPGGTVEVRMDSKLVVEQMSGRWKIRHAGIQPLAQAARDAARALGPVTYHWVPRERNRRADRLANEAMDASARRAQARRPAASAALAPSRQPRARAAVPERAPERAPERGQIASPGPEPAAAPQPSPSLPSGWVPAQQKPTTTLLLRHGETSLSVERRFAGTADLPLTPAGEEQARAAASRIAAAGGVDLIITSPLQRSRRTAEEAARVTGAPLTVERGIAETGFGEWEGLTFAEARQRWPAEVDAWIRSADVAPPGGESFAAVDRRVRAVLRSLLAEHEGKTLLLVSHVTPIKILLRHALLAPPEALYRMHLDVGCLCEIAWYADGPAVVRSLNDTAHLRPSARDT